MSTHAIKGARNENTWLGSYFEPLQSLLSLSFFASYSVDQNNLILLIHFFC
jgi:hypothetical protein